MVELTKKDKEVIKQIMMNKQFNRMLEEKIAKPKFTTDNRERRKKKEAKKAMTGDEAYSMKKESKGGPLGEAARPSPKGKPVMVKGGGLMEATANLKAKGMKDGGMVMKDKTVAMDKSPNSGLITTKGFGASRRT